MLVGLLLVGGVGAARAAKLLGLPALTGHFVAGLMIGGLVSPTANEASASVLGTLHQAVGAVLLFWIGSQLRLRRLLRDRGSVPIYAGAALLSVAVCAAVLSFGAPGLGLLPDGADTWEGVAILALVLSTTSPTVIAVVARERDVKGPFARTALDAAVLANVGLAFLVVLLVGSSTPGEGAQNGASAWAFAGHICAGAAVGGALGALVAWSPRAVPPSVHLVCAGLAFLALKLEFAHPETAMVAGALMAGLALAVSERELPVVESVSRAVPTVSAVLFTVAGALADLGTVLSFAVPALVIVLVRASALWLGARLAGVLSQDEAIRRFGFAPLLPQAGFSLALVGALGATSELATVSVSLVLAAVVINELAMPPVLRLALWRSAARGGLAA